MNIFPIYESVVINDAGEVLTHSFHTELVNAHHYMICAMQYHSDRPDILVTVEANEPGHEQYYLRHEYTEDKWYTGFIYGLHNGDSSRCLERKSHAMTRREVAK